MKSKTKIETAPQDSPNTLLRLGAVVVSALAVGGTADHIRSDNSTVNVPEVVKQYDNPWTLVRRADKDAHIDPDAVDMRPAVDRITEQYGTVLQPGQRIIVKLNK
jgi:hypothetical protein